MGRRFRPRRGTVRPNLPFGACGLSVGEEQPSFPRAGGCGPGPHSLVWGVRVGRPRLLGRTALGRALASGRQSGLPTIRLAKAGYYWFEPFRAARAWRRRGLGVSRHGLSLFRGAARYKHLSISTVESYYTLAPVLHLGTRYLLTKLRTYSYSRQAVLSRFASLRSPGLRAGDQ